MSGDNTKPSCGVKKGNRGTYLGGTHPKPSLAKLTWREDKVVTS